MANLSTTFSGLPEETSKKSARLEQVLAQYPVGSGSYAVLDIEEKNAEAYYVRHRLELQDTKEGGRLQMLLGKVRDLLKAEQRLASQRQIDAGQSTPEIEEEKRLAYEAGRAAEGITPLWDSGEGEAAGNLGPILLIAGLGAGAYFLMR